MRVLVTGAKGQLGRHFSTIAPEGWTIIQSHRDGGAAALDLEGCLGADDLVARVDPDWIFHAGAWTDVDGCEAQPAKAMAINAAATGALANAAAEAGARMLYISTDYVFDGLRGNYSESDATNPESVYGSSKLAGERLAREHLPGVAIARTSVVFGPHIANFVRWAAKALVNHAPLRIVEDQWVTPTYTGDLARQTTELMKRQARGIFHCAGATRVSRLEMVTQLAETLGISGNITPIRMASMNWKATRPRDSSLDTTKIRQVAQPMTLSESYRSFLQEASCES